MNDGVFYNAQIEFIFEVYFREFSKKNTALFKSKKTEEQLDELFENKTLFKEFARFIVRKIHPLVFSTGESDRLKELFESKVN